MRLYHGTTSARAEAILRDGFALPAYFAPDLEGAAHYAACGGEWDLQEREEAHHAEHGEWPREAFDTSELHRRLYPHGEEPVVLVVDVPDEAAALFRKDDGAEGALVTELPVPREWHVETVVLAWDPDDLGPPTRRDPEAFDVGPVPGP